MILGEKYQSPLIINNYKLQLQLLVKWVRLFSEQCDNQVGSSISNVPIVYLQRRN